MRLLSSRVAHERQKPAKNSFEYKVYYVETDVTDSLQSGPALFSRDRFNVFSLARKDHGARDRSSWRNWFARECAVRGIALEKSDDVRLICHPRLFGYAFNPISFWLLRRSGKLLAVLCEVNNTFGDNHNYLLCHDDLRPILPTDRFRADKKLYVSPFNKVQGHYLFRFTATEERFSAEINYFAGEEITVAAYMGGTFSPLTNASILRSVLMYPLMTLLVVYRIHLQAARLWFKGVPPTISTMPEKLRGGTTQGSAVSRE